MRKRALSRREPITGPVRRIESQRRLTREELDIAGLELHWSLLTLSCGHSVIRIPGKGQQGARCGACEEAWG